MTSDQVSFPGPDLNEGWPHVLQAVTEEVARRRLHHPPAALGSTEQLMETRYLEDINGTIRTKLCQDGAFSDFTAEEIGLIFNNAPMPRLGVATHVRGGNQFRALEEAIRHCAPLGKRYCIALMAARRTEYRQSEGRLLLQVCKRLELDETFFAMALRPDDTLPADTVRVSILTA